MGTSLGRKDGPRQMFGQWQSRKSSSPELICGYLGNVIVHPVSGCSAGPAQAMVQPASRNLRHSIDDVLGLLAVYRKSIVSRKETTVPAHSLVDATKTQGCSNTSSADVLPGVSRDTASSSSGLSSVLCCHDKCTRRRSLRLREEPRNKSRSSQVALPLPRFFS